MNAARRKAITGIHERLTALVADLQAIRDEEEQALENLPDSLKDGAKGEAMQTAVDQLGTVIDDIENAASELTEVAA